MSAEGRPRCDPDLLRDRHAARGTCRGRRWRRPAVGLRGLGGRPGRRSVAVGGWVGAGVLLVAGTPSAGRAPWPIPAGGFLAWRISLWRPGDRRGGRTHGVPARWVLSFVPLCGRGVDLLRPLPVALPGLRVAHLRPHRALGLAAPWSPGSRSRSSSCCFLLLPGRAAGATWQPAHGDAATGGPGCRRRGPARACCDDHPGRTGGDGRQGGRDHPCPGAAPTRVRQRGDEYRPPPRPRGCSSSGTASARAWRRASCRSSNASASRPATWRGRLRPQPHRAADPPLRRSESSEAPCLRTQAEWRSTVASFDPDVVLAVLGWPGDTERYVDGRWRRPCDPVYDRWYAGEVAAGLHVLARGKHGSSSRRCPTTGRRTAAGHDRQPSSTACIAAGPRGRGGHRPGGVRVPGARCPVLGAKASCSVPTGSTSGGVPRSRRPRGSCRRLVSAPLVPPGPFEPVALCVELSDGELLRTCYGQASQKVDFWSRPP